MNKEQAAVALGITVRTLQRHMAAHRIGFAMQRTVTGEEATFSREEVARFKAERDALTTTVTPAANVSESVRDAPPEALQRGGNEQGMAMLVSMLTDAMRATQGQGYGASDVPVADNLALSITDAAGLPGLSANHMSEAIKLGTLKARIIGRGWKIAPDILKTYVTKILNNR